MSFVRGLHEVAVEAARVVDAGREAFFLEVRLLPVGVPVAFFEAVEAARAGFAVVRFAFATGWACLLTRFFVVRLAAMVLRNRP